MSSYLPRSQVYVLTYTEGLTSDTRIIMHSSDGYSVMGVNSLEVIGWKISSYLPRSQVYILTYTEGLTSDTCIIIPRTVIR